MTWLELFIINLAIGAPFGVHYFLQKRYQFTHWTIWLRVTSVILLWFVYAAFLLCKQNVWFAVKLKNCFINSVCEQRIETLNQNLQINFAQLNANDTDITFFEFRELLERYIGLTLAVQSSSVHAPAAEHEQAIYRIAGEEKNNLKLAARCLHRKNYLRLQTHQMRARQDLLKTLVEVKSAFIAQKNFSSEVWQQLVRNVQLLCETLNDVEAVELLPRALFDMPIKVKSFDSAIQVKHPPEKRKSSTAFPALQTESSNARLE